MGTPPSTILIVSGFPDERDMYVDWLQQVGFQVLSCCDGHSAFDIAASSRPCVVVTDTVLPDGGDGVDLIRRLRQDDRTKTTSIIVVTGRVMPADRDRALEAGCDVFLPKPLPPDVLAHEVRRVLAARRRQTFTKPT